MKIYVYAPNTTRFKKKFLLFPKRMNKSLNDPTKVVRWLEMAEYKQKYKKIGQRADGEPVGIWEDLHWTDMD